VAKASYCVKGTHLTTSRAWLDQRLGEGTYAKFEAAVGVPWDARVLPSGWYDVFAMVRLVEQGTKQLKVSIFDAYTEIASANATQDLTTIYRAFLRLAGPRGLLNATPTLWRNYVAFGEVKKVANESGLHIAEVHGIPDAVLEWSCGAWNGFVPTAVVLAGGSNPSLVIEESGPDPLASEPGLSFMRARVDYDPPA
jgi:hypothetical protein